MKDKNSIALMLTTASALVAHISIYITSNCIKYLVAGVGVLLAVVGAVIVFKIRKPFVREYSRSDWQLEDEKDAPYYLAIPFKEHKKRNPSSKVESLVSGVWLKNDKVLIGTAQEGSEDDILLVHEMMGESIAKINFDNLDKIRVTIR